MDKDGNITAPTITASTAFSGSGASLTSIPETAITNGALLARVADNETISGLWTFGTAAGSGNQDLTIGTGTPGTIGGLYFDDGSGFLGHIVFGTGLTANREYLLPDGGGSFVIGGTQATLFGSSTSTFNSSTATFGAAFQDSSTTSKKLRMVLSNAVGNNSLTFTNTAARNYGLDDFTGTVVVVGNTTSAAGTLGRSDLTGQSASITSTTLMTSSANSSGMFRVSCYVKCTTGGVGGDKVVVQIQYNDGSAQTADMRFTKAASAVPTTLDHADLTTTNESFYSTALVYSAASNAITYTTTYTGAGSPVYTIRMRIEALG